MIRFACPQCGKTFSLGDEAAGRKAKCPCGHSLTVPNGQPPVVAPVAHPANIAPPLAPPTIHRAPPPAAPSAGTGYGQWSGSPHPLTCLGTYIAAGMLLVTLVVVGIRAHVPGIFYVVAVALSLLIVILAEVERRATKYRLTADAICIKTGILSKITKELPVDGLLQMTVSQSLTQRLIGLGTLSFATAATGSVEMTWRGVSSPESIRDMVRKLQEMRK